MAQEINLFQAIKQALVAPREIPDYLTQLACYNSAIKAIAVGYSPDIDDSVRGMGLGALCKEARSEKKLPTIRSGAIYSGKSGEPIPDACLSCTVPLVKLEPHA